MNSPVLPNETGKISHKSLFLTLFFLRFTHSAEPKKVWMRMLPPETMEARFGLQETIQVHNAPASLMPSCRICPSGAYQKHDNQVKFIEQITLVQFGILLTSFKKYQKWHPLSFYRLTTRAIVFDSGITCHLFQRKMPHCKPPFLLGSLGQKSSPPECLKNRTRSTPWVVATHKVFCRGVIGVIVSVQSTSFG